MKKGFTLVELLAVIFLLGLIITIALPNVANTLRKSKEKLYLSTVEDIKEAATLYMSNHLELYKEIDKNNSITIELRDICTEGLIECPVLNPMDSTEMNGSILVKKENNDYIYNYQE